MIKNFEEVKKQLTELSSVINSFKSEAVQLKIVELIFKGVATPEVKDENQQLSDPSSATKKPKPKTRKSIQSASEKKGKKTGKIGPATVLNELLTDGYFDKARTLNDIIDYCDKHKARKFKPNELSSPLARFVRNGRLKREKNAENQYEYTKKG